MSVHNDKFYYKSSMNIQQLMYGLKASVFILLLPKKKIALQNYLELFTVLTLLGPLLAPVFRVCNKHYCFLLRATNTLIHMFLDYGQCCDYKYFI